MNTTAVEIILKASREKKTFTISAIVNHNDRVVRRKGRGMSAHTIEQKN